MQDCDAMEPLSDLDDETDYTEDELAAMWDEAEPVSLAATPPFVRVVNSAVHEPMVALTTVESLAVTQLRRELLPATSHR